MIRDDFPDWTIAAPGTESLLKIGFEYGRSVTGQDLNVDLDQYEESNPTTADLNEDETMVTTTAEASIIHLHYISLLDLNHIIHSGI